MPTDMLTLNSTVKIFYRNPSTFFGVHVTSTPLELHYFDLKVASGHVSDINCDEKRVWTLTFVLLMILNSSVHLLYEQKVCLISLFQHFAETILVSLRNDELNR